MRGSSAKGFAKADPEAAFMRWNRRQTSARPQGKNRLCAGISARGAADAAHFPYATWARLMREVLSEQSATLLLSGDPQGEPALRREIAGYLHRMRGMDVPPDAIVLGAGTEVLVSALVALIGRERLFAVEDPRLFACAAHSGGQRRADCADAAFRRGHRRARTVSKRRRRGLRYPDPSISDGRGDAARPAGSAAALGARDGRLYFGG